MQIGPKRIIAPQANSALTKRAVPELLNTFSNGLERSSPGMIIKGMSLWLLLYPVMFLATCVTSLFRFVGLILITWLISSWADLTAELTWLVFGVGFLLFYLPDIIGFIAEYAVGLLIFLTGGGFLRWLCSGNLQGGMFRQMFLASERMSGLITTLVEVLPDDYRFRYYKVIEIVTDGSLTEEEALRQLDSLIETPVG